MAVFQAIASMRLSLRIPAVLAAVQFAEAWRTTALSRFGSAGESSAKLVGAVVGLLAVGAITAFGVIQVWRLRRSGLVVLGLFYVIFASMQSLAIHDGRGSWLRLSFSALMLMAFLSPHAWRICADHSSGTQPEAAVSRTPGLP